MWADMALDDRFLLRRLTHTTCASEPTQQTAPWGMSYAAHARALSLAARRRARGVRFGSSRGRPGACRHGTCGPPPVLPLHRPVHMGRLGSGHAPVGRCSAVHGDAQAHGGPEEQNGPKTAF